MGRGNPTPPVIARPKGPRQSPFEKRSPRFARDGGEGGFVYNHCL